MSLIRRLKSAVSALLGITLLWTAPSHATGTTPLALAVQADSGGNAVPGCLLYFFVAGTVATPQNAYSDFGLTNPLPNPLSCDQAGRVPMHWLADGLIHIRLTDASGLVIIDTTMQVLGPSSGGGGGGGGGTVDPTALISTGDLKARYGTGVASGFVRANGLTIGNASSGATERANADTQALFIYLYNADANLVVSGGRTGNALNDYNASKQLTLPDWRGRAIAALDDMGNTAAGRLTAAYFGTSATVLGAAGGAQTHTLTLSELATGIAVSGSNNIAVSGTNSFTASGNNTITASGANSISVTSTVSNIVTSNNILSSNAVGGSNNQLQPPSTVTSVTSTGSNLISVAGNNTINVGGSVSINSSGTNTITGTSTNTGGQPHAIVQPTMLATIYIKL